MIEEVFSPRADAASGLRNDLVSVLAAALIFATLALPGLAEERHEKASDDATSHRSFDDVEHWARVFDDPERDAWQKPVEVVSALKLARGDVVADLGAGTGYFNRHLAEAVGERGTVFAVDVEPQLLEHMRARAERERTANVVPVLASPDHPRLPPAGVDLILIVDTYHHFNDRLAYLRHLAGALAPGGRVAVIDWFKRELPEGPPLAHKLPRKRVVKEMEAAGYELIEEPRFLPYQYFLIFRPRAGG